MRPARSGRGIKGYTHAVHRLLPGGFRQRRRRHEDLEAGDGEVPEAGSRHELQEPAAPDRARQAGRVPSLYGLCDRRRDQEAGEGGLHRRDGLRLQRLRPAVGFIGWSPGPGSRSPQFSTIYAIYSRAATPQKVAAEQAGEGAKPRRRPRREEEGRGREEEAREEETRRVAAALRLERTSSRRGYPASCRRTSAATAPPSALPLVCGVTTPITLPIPLGPSSAAPVPAMARRRSR